MEQAIPVGSDYKDIFSVALNLAAACFVAGCVIAASFAITEPYAKINRVKMADEAMRQLFPAATTFTQMSQNPAWMTAEQNGERLGYVLTIRTKGYGGAMKIMAATDTMFRIRDFSLLSHNETPGLGDGANKPAFKKQFEGKAVEALFVVKNHDPGKIDAMTGATITSRAVTDAMRTEITALRDCVQKSGFASSAQSNTINRSAATVQHN